ncbi:MAG: hypothetical protein AB7O66_18970 [Limisphaerales bacterium]
MASAATLPDSPTWQLVEALCLLGVLLRAQQASAPRIHLFGKSGPVEIVEDGISRHLWAQPSLQGERSALGGRPDLVITSTAETPHSGNALRIIEAKCVRELDTPTLRSEFGKAHDLRVVTYFIWSFYTPPKRIVDGARGLGIELQALGLDSEWREELLRHPELLVAHVANAQSEARSAARFAKALEAAGRDAGGKLVRAE